MKVRLLFSFIIFSTSLFAGDFRGGDIHIQQYTASSVQANININLIIHSEVENILICWGDGSCDILGNAQVIEDALIDTKTLHFFWIHEYNQPGTYEISVGECCWANDIFNMNLVEDQDFIINTTFKLVTPSEPYNVMPYSANLPVIAGNINEYLVYNSLVSIPDSDESTFEICEVEVDNYFLLEDIFTQQNNFYFDEITGGFTWFSPPSEGYFIVKVCMTTTRGGQLISETSRDILIAIQNTVDIDNIEKASTLKLKYQPNPVQDFIQLEYQLTKNSNIKIDLFNISGKQVKTLFSGNKSIGSNTQNFDVDDLPQGFYFLKVMTDNEFTTIPFIKN